MFNISVLVDIDILVIPHVLEPFVWINNDSNDDDAPDDLAGHCFWLLVVGTAYRAPIS